MTPEMQRGEEFPVITYGSATGGAVRVGCRPPVQLYGWDSRISAWSGPSELSLARGRASRLEKALRASPGPSWYGPVSCAASGEDPNRFFAVIHRLADCAVATIYCRESRTGPMELITIIPAERRSLVRPDFAFELVAFASFLGAVGHAHYPDISAGIETALAETSASDSLVFSIGTGLWVGDLEHVLSRCVEKVAVAMLDWFEAR